MTKEEFFKTINLKKKRVYKVNLLIYNKDRENIEINKDYINYC